MGAIWVRVTLSLILGAAACSGEAGQGPSATVPISGTFALFRNGGTLIPAPIAELPDHNQNPSGCWYSLTEGSLVLTAETGLFSYLLTYRNSCDDRLLGTTAVSGRYRQVGATLQFATRGVRLDFIRPGRPVENCFIESFNGKLRDGCLNQHHFATLAEARTVLETWRQEFTRTAPTGD